MKENKTRRIAQYGLLVAAGSVTGSGAGAGLQTEEQAE